MPAPRSTYGAFVGDGEATSGGTRRGGTAFQRAGSSAPLRDNGPMSAVDEYLAGLDEEQRIQLERIRRIVKETVPDVEEASSYGMPAFKYRGRPVLGFTARKNHLSIHPFSPDAVEAVRDKLGAYDISKGTIRFTEDLPIPADILKQVVNARLQEIVGSTRP